MRTENLTNMTDLRSFLDLCHFFRRFLTYFASGAASLNKKLCKGQLQVFDQLAVDKITALETINAKLV